jgi:NhaA family Na+:H+ antiporter
MLHKPVAFLILPVFALANTGIIIGSDWAIRLGEANSIGIIAGLFIGKPVGILIASLAAVKTGICRLPLDLNWRHVFGAGILGGIGFTMSIFITNLAFSDRADLITESKISILVASAAAAVCGIIWLKIFGQPTADDTDPETMDLDE